ncbi:MAG: alpha/beta fold hydrolase [Fidelibacterota bacterium]|nr:MAG: alpha/beta fold hydrolase [Candidatus Neomarinimicrobiota bacterium]
MRRITLVVCILPLLSSLSCNTIRVTEEIAYQSGPFRVVGDLRLPPGVGPHPVIIFVHGDGPNNRTSGVTYPPIMDRMLGAGYATFAWDKPGTGESTGQIDRNRLLEQRSQIVLDAVEMLKELPEIDTLQIGLWGISQAGYVMPRVLDLSEDIAFIIAVSCPGEPGVEQGAYLIAAQALCAGASEEEASQIEYLLAEIEKADDYETYVRYKEQLASYAVLEGLGLNLRVATEEQWHHPNFEGDYFRDPMTVIERTTIPILAFFGEKDTQADPIQGAQAYRAALERAGNQNFRVELIPGVDHNLIISETGSLKERERRSRSGWQNYAPIYLDILEEWLRELRQQ